MKVRWLVISNYVLIFGAFAWTQMELRGVRSLVETQRQTIAKQREYQTMLEDSVDKLIPKLNTAVRRAAEYLDEKEALEAKLRLCMDTKKSAAYCCDCTVVTAR